MNIKQERARSPRGGLRAKEMLSHAEKGDERSLFNYERDVTSKARERAEQLAEFFAEDMGSEKLPSDVEEAWGAILFLESIGKPFPVNTQKVMEVAKAWKKHQESIYGWKKISSRLGPEDLIKIAGFVSLNPDTRMLLQDIIKSQRSFLSAEVLRKEKQHDQRTYVLPAMVLFPEQKTQLLGLQDSWAPAEAEKLKKALKSGWYVQDSEFWRLLGDLIAAPGYLPQWRATLDAWWQDKKDSLSFGLEPKSPDERIYITEMNAVYDFLVGQLLSGIKVGVDPNGRLHVEPTSVPLVSEHPLPDRLVA